MRRRTASLLAAAAALSACGPGHNPSRPEPSANVARGQAVVVAGRGEGSLLTDGRLATEGTFPAGHSVALDQVSDAAVVDLGGIRPVAALLLQASTSDIYFVEASADGTSWRVVWRVPGLPGRPVLRTWTTVLPRPVDARWLRIRTTTLRSAAVSELQVFPSASPRWPPLDTRPPGSPLPPWPNVDGERLAAIYEALSTLFVLVVLWGVLLRRGSSTAGERRAQRGVLVALALAALAAWPYMLNFHSSRFVHVWDTFHYYLGAKYLPEVGYTGLYACTLAVDAEDGVELGDRVVRDLRDNRRLPATTQLERARECRARFTPERWEAFRRDTAFFRSAMGEEAWFRVRNDHGFNGTPAWAVLGGAIAGLAPASWSSLLILSLLDIALLAATFLLIGRGFGLEAAAVAAGYFGLNSLSQFGWTGGSFLRYDWLFWLVGGIVALKAGRPAMAGFALVSSTMLRAFPVCVLMGLGLKAVQEVARDRSLRPLLRHRRLAAGALASGLLFFLAPVLQHGDLRVWGAFVENTTKHVSTLSINHVGLPVALSYDHDTRIEIMTDPLRADGEAAWREHLGASARRARGAHWGAVAAFVLLLGIAVRRVPDWTAATLGVGLMPMLLKLSGYYYSGWVVYAVLWPVSAGSGLAFATFTWVTNVIPQVWPGSDERYAWLSLAAVALATGITVAFAWKERRSPE